MRLLVCLALGALVSMSAVVVPASSAMAADGFAVIEGLVGKADGAREELEKVRQILEEANKAGNPEDVQKAEEQVKQAESDVVKADKRLDDARVDAIAQEAGVSPAKVRELRQSGLGWGRVAQELGIHPSKLGKGKAFKDKSNGKDKSSGNKVTKKGDDSDEDDLEDDSDDGEKEKTKKKGKPGKSEKKGKGKK